jgi:1-phosphofructokinase family hexose kinase
MIVTVTLNTALDRTFFIEDFQWGQTIRASKTAIGMGGKATDASWILGELGYPNLALGFAAGATGRLMKKMLEERGCTTSFVWVKGETRTNIIVVSEEGRSQSTLTSEGLVISGKDVQRLLTNFKASLRDAECLILGGSLPSGVEASIFTRMVRYAREAGLPVIFDASGPGLSAGLEGGPTIAKPNLDELSWLVRYQVSSVSQAYQAAKELQSRYKTDFIITLGNEGALAVLADRSYLIPVLDIPVVSTAGAGDGVLAGLAAAFHSHKPVEEGLRLGFACAAAVCLTPATADCRRADVYNLLPRIKLIPYN